MLSQDPVGCGRYCGLFIATRSPKAYDRGTPAEAGSVATALLAGGGGRRLR